LPGTALFVFVIFSKHQSGVLSQPILPHIALCYFSIGRFAILLTVYLDFPAFAIRNISVFP
jgi:hypothetical protein